MSFADRMSNCLQIMEAEEDRLWKELRDAAYQEADTARDLARQRFEVPFCFLSQVFGLFQTDKLCSHLPDIMSHSDCSWHPCLAPLPLNS